ncbi:MAG: capsular polysaccharide synthesis protein [Desulfobulbaceae bacterium]|nr:capsular polysaccharide synthesis protein [Desulfobulbaceae bacterium]
MKKYYCEELSQIPRKIWFLWFQGMDNAPFVVRKCYESWKERNPNWELIFLSDENLSHYASLALPPEKIYKLTKALYSDFIRLELLSKYGGVWVDSTCFCVDSLDNWLGEYTSSGFFAFYQPAPDRVMSSWFLASEKGHPIVVKLIENLIYYWLKNDLSNEGKEWLIEKLNTLFNRNSLTTKYWFSFIVTKIFKAFPYCALHYKFAELVMTVPECFAIWNNTKKFNANIPHKLQHAGLFSPLVEEIKKEIDNKKVPLYKLTWKYNHADLKEGSILHYLFESLQINETTKQAITTHSL